MGSSPLTRGKHFIIQDVPKCGRLIPAHAGKTSRARREPDPRTAHPRSRGENHDLPVDELHFTGSSPLTRGKRFRVHGRRRGHRLIPAHAGKTATEAPGQAPQRAHPRSRGENRHRRIRPPLRTGSSPLTRGKRLLNTQSAGDARLIPAHAGKTTQWYADWPYCPAHPRSRGENFRRKPFFLADDGSSPLTRGKHKTSRSRNNLHRLIPAHAGKTLHFFCWSGSGSAHPRSRGENLGNTLWGAGKSGSSPLTRGKQAVDRRGGPAGGLIPAHAGKTRTLWPGNHAGVWLIPAHAGKTSRTPRREILCAGSSPLTRGKPARDDDRFPEGRLIPAHAGKTGVSRF